MKFLFLLTYYYPHWTGLTQYAQRLAEGLSEKGDQVTVLTTHHDNNLKAEEIINRVKVKRKAVLFRLSRSLFSIQLVLSLLAEIARNDAVIIYLPFAEVLLTSIISRILGKKLYLIHNGDLLLPGGFFNRLLELTYNLSSKYAILLSDKTIVQTEDYFLNSPLLKPLGDKISVILPLFEETKLKNKKPLKKSNKMVELKMSKYKGYRKIGFAGRFVEEKGFDILLSAISLIVRHNTNIKFATGHLKS